MTSVAAPSVPAGALAWITEQDMVEVDRIMIEDLHIELIQMMENAGRHLARSVLHLAAPATAAVLAGSGGNGGGGLVAARHLANAGVDVVVVTTRPGEEMAPVPAHQLDVVERMGVPRRASVPDGIDVAVDALIGYSLRGAPQGRSEVLVRAAGRAGTVVSLDVPSGLDVTDGTTPGTVVTADATITLAAPKAGLRHSPHVGELYVADISVPPSVLARIGAAAPPFGPEGLVRVV